MAFGRKLLLGLSVVAGIQCFYVGIRYASADVAPVGGVLLTLALLGGTGLIGGGLLQWRAGDRLRFTVLVLLVLAAAGYTAANAFGQAIQGVDFSPADRFAGAHVAGIAAGALLFLASLVEAFLTSRAGAE